MPAAFDLSPARIRQDSAERLRRALAAFDERAYAHPAIAPWLNAAPPRQNRRLWLKAVIATRAARVFSAPALKDCKLAAASAHKWGRAVHDHEQADREFSRAINDEVEAVRQRSMKPLVAMPPKPKRTDNQRRQTS